MSTSVFPISSYSEDHDNPFPFFRQPNIVGHFSLNGNREFIKDLSGLQYFYNRNLETARGVRLDLDKNLEKVIKPLPIKDEEKLNNLLNGVLAYKSRFAVNGELKTLHTDIVCFRGLLTTIMCTPYERKDDWMLEVVRWKGTLYLMQVETPRRRAEKQKETDRQKQMSSWGYKFEQYMTSSAPGVDPDTESPVDENEEFCCLFRTRIDDISLVYGAEMDAYKSETDKKFSDNDPTKSLNSDRFVELKTSRIIQNQRQDRNFRKFKLLKWWAQSFLVGTKQLVCGWRDDDGVVRDLETFLIKEIPKSAVDWKPNVCFNFLSSFLATLKRSITEDDLNSVHRVVWDPNMRKIQISKIVCSTEHILPPWYLTSIFR